MAVGAPWSFCCPPPARLGSVVLPPRQVPWELGVFWGGQDPPNDSGVPPKVTVGVRGPSPVVLGSPGGVVGPRGGSRGGSRGADAAAAPRAGAASPRLPGHRGAGPGVGGGARAARGPPKDPQNSWDPQPSPHKGLRAALGLPRTPSNPRSPPVNPVEPPRYSWVHSALPKTPWTLPEPPAPLNILGPPL